MRATIYNWSRPIGTSTGAVRRRRVRNAAIGEASVRYLYFDGAAERIRATLPEVRLVAILRDPSPGSTRTTT